MHSDVDVSNLDVLCNRSKPGAAVPHLDDTKKITRRMFKRFKHAAHKVNA
jgi:hypothetical protein